MCVICFLKLIIMVINWNLTKKSHYIGGIIILIIQVEKISVAQKHKIICLKVSLLISDNKVELWPQVFNFSLHTITKVNPTLWTKVNFFPWKCCWLNWKGAIPFKVQHKYWSSDYLLCMMVIFLSWLHFYVYILFNYKVDLNNGCEEIEFI